MTVRHHGVSLDSPATVEQVINASQGDGIFAIMIGIAVGLAIGTDAIEMTLLSYLVPCVSAEWNLSNVQEGTLTASVFAGEMVGAMGLGIFSDHYGRRLGFLVATLLVFVFGVLTSVAPSYWWLLFCRSLVGVGAGGMEVPFDLLTELVDMKRKARFLVNVQMNWALGSLFVGIMAWAVLSSGLSWRWLALVAALPPGLVLCCFAFVPESPRWLLVNNRHDEAKEMLKSIAKTNNVELPDFTLKREEKYRHKEGRGVLEVLRRPELRWRSYMAWIVWFSFAFTYYGVILLSADLLEKEDSCSFDYAILFFASSSEILGNLMMKYYVDRVDRRVLISVHLVVAGVMTFLLALYSDLGWLMLFSFIARGSAYISTSFIWILTPSLYPTEIRSTGHAVSNCFARLGGVAASYWVDSTGMGYTKVSLLITFFAFSGAAAAQGWPKWVSSLGAEAEYPSSVTERRPLLAGAPGEEEEPKIRASSVVRL